MKSKLIAIALLIASLAILATVNSSSGQSPQATPAPATPAPATPAPATPSPVPLVAPQAPPSLLTARAMIPAAVFSADLNAVPATPQSLLQLLATFTPLPAGVSAAQIKSVTVLMTPSGGANVTVQYVTQ